MARPMVLLLVALTACSPEVEMPEAASGPPWLTSIAFDAGAEIPSQYTCDGDDVPPPLRWVEVPVGAVELALVVDDPDARSFVHWLVAGLPAGDGALQPVLPPGAVEGTNDFGSTGWAGPCPPVGDEPHTYRFEVIALSEESGLEPGFSAAELDAATGSSQLASGVLVGTYGR